MSKEYPRPEQPSGGGAGLFPGWEHEKDTRLIARIQRRDEGALGELYDLWVDRVYSIALKVLGDHDEAEEVVEWTFTQVWRDASRYDPARGAVGAWIVVIARSYALTRVRALGRRARHDELRTAHLAMEGMVSAASPLQEMESGEHRQLVDHAVSRLPEEQQRVVRMTFFEGLSQNEIASQLGIPLGTVKTRIRLAFSKLRGLLADLRERDR
jgi:RNA polymerase sigma-70 factor (ECF subfamily)